MTMLENAADGLWVCSSREESWPPGPFFTSYSEALEYANVNGALYLGQVTVLSAETVASFFIRDASDAEVKLCEQDEWSWVDDQVISEPSEKALDELHSFVVEWLDKHKLYDKIWCVLNSRRITEGS